MTFFNVYLRRKTLMAISWNLGWPEVHYVRALAHFKKGYEYLDIQFHGRKHLYDEVNHGVVRDGTATDTALFEQYNWNSKTTWLVGMNKQRFPSKITTEETQFPVAEVSNLPPIYQCTNQIENLAQDCSNSIELAIELLQSCAKPSK